MRILCGDSKVDVMARKIALTDILACITYIIYK